jgi:hypothetical protein
MLQPPAMRIDTHQGTIADPANDADVARAIASLTDPAKAFIVMSEAIYNETYLQAAGTLDEGFIVEYRDGSAGEHYRADVRVGPIALGQLLRAYLHGQPSWREAIAWHRVVIDGPRPAA